MVLFVLWRGYEGQVGGGSPSVLLVVVEEVDQGFLLVLYPVFEESTEDEEVQDQADPVAYEEHGAEGEHEVPEVAWVSHVLVDSMCDQFVCCSFVMLNQVGEIAFGREE